MSVDDNDDDRLNSTNPPPSSETDALLGQNERPSLYQTISRHSDADFLPPDGVDVELAKAVGNQAQKGVYTTLSVLLLGLFISQIDMSFMMATYGQVSSEFNQLESGTWLMTAYVLAQCVAQPLYGKLSDIYGRKTCLQASYILFAIGTAISGVGQSMGQVITGRAIQGAGGAGMLSMVSIIITDLVPVHEVARLRSYANVLGTSGRSIGGVIGGALTQTIGWRWAFLVQIPPTLLAILLVQWKLSIAPKHISNDQSSWEKLKRVDFVGSAFLCYSIFSLCLVLDVGGQKYPWNSPVIISFIATGCVAIILFIISAKHVAEPIFPLRLVVHYDVVTNYIITLFQFAVQLSMMLSVPIYFQAVKRSSTSEAGLYLVPAFFGNTIGGLFVGHWIRRTGRYKLPTVIAPLLSVASMVLCLVFWNGEKSGWQSLTVFPGGIATGAVSSSAFVGLAAGLPPEDVAVAASGMYLCTNVGTVLGASIGSAAFQMTLRPALAKALSGVENKAEIIRNLLDSIANIQDVPDRLRNLVIPAYVKSFHAVSVFGLVCAGISLIFGVCSREKRIDKN